MMIKSHKDGRPLRPIIDGIFNPFYSAWKSFNGILDSFRSKNNFDVKDSLEVKERLVDLERLTEEHVR